MLRTAIQQVDVSDLNETAIQIQKLSNGDQFISEVEFHIV